jgi:hypothetical protein
MSLPRIIIAKPPVAMRGSRPEIKSAYDGLSDVQRDQALQEIRTRSGPLQQQIRSRITPQTSSGVSRIKAADILTNSISFVTDSANVRPTGPGDSDLDQLPDKFERRLANAFTPFYHTSGGEVNVFATFADQATLTVATLGQATPPISHYRVTPIGFTNGTGFLQIDYLTIWNRDNGLSISTTCAIMSAGLGLTLDGLASHEFDEERSAVLVGAPVQGDSYSTDVGAYKAYDFYLAAHEGVLPFDHSGYIEPSNPASAGSHIELSLSRSKHATYPFNPNKSPIFRGEIIEITYAQINAAHAEGKIDDITYDALLYAATTVFFECIVERFRDQGGAYAGTRINVGELNKPLNGCSWINDPRIRSKLTPPLWQAG